MMVLCHVRVLDVSENAWRAYSNLLECISTKVTSTPPNLLQLIVQVLMPFAKRFYLFSPSPNYRPAQGQPGSGRYPLLVQQWYL